MAVLGFVLALFALFLTYSAVTTARQKVVVIQPGHSLGYDSGATSNYKSEAQLNQELAGRVVRILNDRGYKVYITHTTDSELQGQKLISNEAASHLANVGAAVNSVSPDLALSLHHNSGGSTASGYELYWSSYRDYDQSGIYEVPGLWSDGSNALRDSSPCPDAVGSQRLAEVIKSKMEGIPNLSFRSINERDDYLPAHAHCPCILYEGGYLSNPAEAAYLASEQYVSEASNRIANAVDEFLGGAGDGGTTPQGQTGPKINSVTSSTTQTSGSSFTVSCNATDDVGIKAVHFASWTEAGGQDDLLWKDGVNTGVGTWSCTIDISEHGNQTGKYITHVYAEDTDGNQVGVEAPMVEVLNASSMGNNPSPTGGDTSTQNNSTASVEIYRVYNNKTGEHLYTASPEEVSTLCKSNDWDSEGVAWNAPTQGTPVYRLFNSALNDHLYTTDENEVNALTSGAGWVADNGRKPIFYANTEGRPIYRLYSEALKRHLLTKDENEYKTLGSSGWTQEGIVFCGINS